MKLLLGCSPAKNLLFTLMLVLPALLLAGCGGGSDGPGNPGGTSEASFTVHWPGRSRLIPVASESIKVVIANPQGQTVATNLMQRPAAGGDVTVIISPLPTGDLPVTATAYPNADGTGTPQGTASLTLHSVAGQVQPVTLSLNSTVASVTISALSLNVPVGGSQQLTHTERDANGAVVLTLPKTITWTSSNTAVATVDSTGKVTGVSSGTADITVTETESGKNRRVTMTVGFSSNTGGVIAFVGTLTGKVAPSLYTMRPDGGSLTDINPTPGGSGLLHGAALSPDRNYVAIGYHTSAGIYDSLFVMPADGSSRPGALDVKVHQGWSWSPDSSRLAYSAATDSGASDGVHVVNRDGTGDTKIAGSSQFPDWSPDGARIAAADFVAKQIFLLKPDGTGRQNLTTGSDAKWFPDNHRLAFRRGDGGEGLYIINDDGTGEKQVASYVDGTYAISPDGTKIAYWSSSPPGVSPAKVFVYDVGSGATKEIAPGAFPAWSPDSQWITYSYSTGLHMVHPDGTGDYVLPGIAGAGYMSWR